MPADFSTVRTSADDTAVILYTSGTTGQPKGTELTHQNMLLNAIVADEMFPREGLGKDTYLVALPLFHSFGQTTMLNAGFRRRAALVLLPRFDPGPALELIRQEEVTLFGGVPTMYEVEDVLMTHPQVSLPAVVGVPHESHGEEVKAYVIRTPGATITEEELIAWGKENFAIYEYSRIVEFRDTLPMTATGKILKRDLR
jgi:long-chain acyl-CoA synthetase